MSRGQQPGHVVLSAGKTFYVTSTGDFVEHVPAKYHAARERSRWSRNKRMPVDNREFTI